MEYDNQYGTCHFWSSHSLSQAHDMCDATMRRPREDINSLSTVVPPELDASEIPDRSSPDSRSSSDRQVQDMPAVGPCWQEGQIRHVHNSGTDCDVGSPKCFEDSPAERRGLLIQEPGRPVVRQRSLLVPLPLRCRAEARRQSRRGMDNEI